MSGMTDVFWGRWISLLYRYGLIFVAKELEPYNIGKGQFMFLLALYKRDGMLQEEVATLFNIDKGTTARAISKLEKAGYVIRKPNDQDLRSNHVFLTQQGMDFKPRLYAILQRWTDILSTGMTAEETEKALDLLTKMSRNATMHIHKERQ